METRSLEERMKTHDNILKFLLLYFKNICNKIGITLKKPVFPIGIEYSSNYNEIYECLNYNKKHGYTVSPVFTKKNSEDMFIYNGRLLELLTGSLRSFGEISENFLITKDKVEFLKIRISNIIKDYSYLAIFPYDVIVNNILTENSTFEQIERNCKTLLFACVCDLNLYAGNNVDFISHKVKNVLYTHDAVYDLLSPNVEKLNKQFLITDEKQFTEHFKNLNEDYDKKYGGL